jgi:hypothetical protein
MHLLAKKLSCLKVQECAAAHRSDHVARGERGLTERDAPQSPSHGRDPHPASIRGLEADLHQEARPERGSVRGENTFSPSSPSGHSADGKDSGSRRCSKHGQCVGALQKPDATNVAGIRTWNSLGRFVKRGEKGIFILAPMIGKKRSQDENATSEDADKKDSQPRLYGFRGVYVFDRLSRDLRPSLCAPDGSRQCHFRKSPR